MINKVVVDASVALAWVLPAEDTDQALSLRNQALSEPQLILLVPPTFWYEVTNVLWVATRRHRLSNQNAQKALDMLIDFEFTVWAAELKRCLNLSLDHNLSVYDNAYLELAIDQQATLWTMDQQLKKGAHSLNIKVLP
ncbi:MAG: type II toxin-antitoxin system VapC family toxin [Firmicutes bacterium]|nr:type II toxin-antitoxin system VapC family toxin [Bacillota bacterium]